MRKLFFTIFSAFVSFAVSADRFSEIADSIVSGNPEFAVQSSKIEAGKLAELSENLLSAPEISVETLFGSTDNKYNVGLTQSFDWPGLYKARKARADASAQAALAQMDAERAALKVDVEGRLISIVTAKKKIGNYSATLSSLSALLEKYRQLYAKGDVSIIDVNKLNIEVADYEQMLADEEQKLADTVNELVVMAPTCDVLSMVSGLVDFPRYSLHEKDVYVKAMTDTSPLLAALRAQSLLDDEDLRVAKLEQRPGFSVGYRYANEDRQSYNGLSLAMELPIWNRNAKKSAAQAARFATDLETETTAQALLSNIDSDYATAVSLKARIDKYGNALTVSDNMSLLKRAFDAGQITLTEYIQDIRYFTEAQIRHYDLQLQYSQTLSALNQYLTF